jgi:hypothetical protein
MKTFRWTILVVMVMIFIVGFAFIAWSGPPKASSSKNQAPPTLSGTVQIMKCPNGWHKKTGTGQEVFRCMPNQPAMPCPDGWEYYFDGCEVGCNKKIEPPK